MTRTDLRSDLMWAGLRGSGLFFMIKAILLLPSVLFAKRATELITGGRQLPELMTLPGIWLPVTTLVVFAVAATVLFLIPVRRDPSAA